MLPLLLLVLLQAQPFEVSGLRPGETFRKVAAPQSEADIRYGRVVSARTGLPVANALIETWTEEISGDGPGPQRIGEARTARDGGFRVPIRTDGVLAEKILVRGRGHLTYPGTLADLDLVRLMPQPEWTQRLRVLDFEDRPIPGALITSTYSCAHDVPAIEVRTDGDGSAHLSHYGLQDHTGDLRVRAPGFAARKYVNVREVAEYPSDSQPAILRLARQGSLRARILGRDGEPLAERVLQVTEGDGYHVPTTDANGAFAVPSCYEGTEASIAILAPGRNQHVFAGVLPDRLEVALRASASEWPDATPVGEITIRTGVRERLSLNLFHPDGWALSTTVRADEPCELEFPAGEILILAGESFSGFEPRVTPLILAPGEAASIDVNPSAELDLEILVNPSEARRITVQAGNRSIVIEPKAAERLTVAIPASTAVIVLAEGAATRRLSLGPLSSNATADLRAPECLLPKTRAQLASTAARGLLRYRIPSNANAELTARGPGNPRVTQTGPSEFEVDAPAGYPVLLHCDIEGAAECWTTAVTHEGRDTEFVHEPVPLASIVLKNETGQELIPIGPEADSLDAIHPGPLSLILQLADGRRGMVSLELAPGEERTLHVRN